jgi:UDP-N-acetyl-D-glucosamine dehydrogenase
MEARFIELAGYINGQMPHFVVDKVQNALNDHSKPLKGSHIHIVGVAYKRDIDDMRESPALDVMLLLKQRGAKLTYSDPHVPSVKIDNVDFLAEDLMSAADSADCTVIVTDHSNVGYEELLDRAKLIVDTRNALKKYTSDKIVRL